MDIHDYLGVLRRGWVFIVLGVLIGIAGGAAAQSVQVPSYSATSRDLITNDTSGDLTRAVQASSLAQARIASYVLVASSGLVLQPVIDELGLDTTVRDLADHITVVAPAQTLVVEITATAATPELARDIANATSASFGKAVASQIETESATAGATPAPTASPAPVAAATPAPVKTLADGTVVPLVTTSPVRVVNIEEAALPAGPNPSNSSLFLAVGAILGLGAGLVAASLRESLDRRIRGRRDVAAVAAQPVVGQIRADNGVRASPLVVSQAPTSAISESFRALRANLDHVMKRDKRNSFVVTAMNPRQGSTTVTANLALAAAATGMSVVVVDGHVRSRGLSRLFGHEGAPGLTEILSGRATLESVLRGGPAAQTWIIPAGSNLSVAEGLLATAAMGEVLTELRGRFDLVLIDAPAITAATDATVLGALDNSTLLIAAEGVATRPGLVDALATLASGGSEPTGIILNRIPRRVRGRRAAARPSASARRTTAKPTRSPRVVEPVAATATTRQRPGRKSRVPAAEYTTILAAPPVTPPPSRFAPPPVPVVTSVPVTSVPVGSVPMATSPVRDEALTEAPVVEPTATETPVEAAIITTVQPVVRLVDAPRRELQTPKRITVGGNVTMITPAVSRERHARERYLQKSRELERAAVERLALEQQRLELQIRDQLDRDRREIVTELDDMLEDTVILPRSADA